MKPSTPASWDPVRPSPPMEPSLPFSDLMRPSPPMKPCLPFFGDPGPSSPPVDAIESIRRMYEKIDPVELIDPLVRFIENQLHKIITPPEAESSSSEGSLAPVRKGIQLAAMTIDTISKEPQKVSESDAVKEMGRIALKIVEGMGELHQVFIALSLAAFAAERYTSLRSTANEWTKLLVKILQLAKDVKVYGEQMSGGKEKLCNAVVTNAEGALIACDYFNGGIVFRVGDCDKSRLWRVRCTWRKTLLPTELGCFSDVKFETMLVLIVEKCG